MRIHSGVGYCNGHSLAFAQSVCPTYLQIAQVPLISANPVSAVA
ncbi:hypothetical protein GA0070609_5057 [Micromonospora echinaurantiaca]|uniref:Uncharacterized protein n=1 Tax=Micromonospora echinaurantiaca TaxID=47857 RepID=A0A1C5JWV8_9ACTN|nr:hypothetical protein GA0070609_5057 [Micromonospora echinaurantiaca]